MNKLTTTATGFLLIIVLATILYQRITRDDNIVATTILTPCEEEAARKLPHCGAELHGVAIEDPSLLEGDPSLDMIVLPVSTAPASVDDLAVANKLMLGDEVNATKKYNELKLEAIKKANNQSTAEAEIEIRTYSFVRVVEGDTLSGLVEKYNLKISYLELKRMNEDIVKDADIIFPNQTLRIPYQPYEEEIRNTSKPEW